MSSYSFTLEDLTASVWGEHPLAGTAFGMKRSGFHRWGFVIYRTTYDDDAAWERYLEVIKLTARQSLDRLGGDVLLDQYMDCRWTLTLKLSPMLQPEHYLTRLPSGPVISDRDKFDGASKAKVREHFKSWCASRSEERDGPNATKNSTKRLPRYKRCLYVDRKCLDTLAKMPADYLETQPHPRGVRPNVVVVVIDGLFDRRRRDLEMDQLSYPDVEGCTTWYVGWRYEEVDFLVSTYENAHSEPLSEFFAYKRPPLISHGISDQDSMPT